jgi:hypothetical protein
VVGAPHFKWYQLCHGKTELAKDTRGVGVEQNRSSKCPHRKVAGVLEKAHERYFSEVPGSDLSDSETCQLTFHHQPINLKVLLTVAGYLAMVCITGLAVTVFKITGLAITVFANNRSRMISTTETICNEKCAAYTRRSKKRERRRLRTI